VWFFKQVVKTMSWSYQLFFPGVFTESPGKCSPGVQLTELETAGRKGGRRVLLVFFMSKGSLLRIRQAEDDLNHF